MSKTTTTIAVATAAFFGAAGATAAPVASDLGLTREESRALGFYDRRVRGFAKIAGQIEGLEADLQLRADRAVGNLEEAMDGLRDTFKDAAVNCLIGALKNAKNIDKLLGKLPRGRLRSKLGRALKSPKARKLLAGAEKTGEALEQGKEAFEAAEEQSDRINDFLETTERDGLTAAVKADIQAAIESEIEEIFPLDLDQPPNEVAVDAFIEISKVVPATAAFSPIFESVAGATKKLVRIYAQSLELDSIEGGRQEVNVIRKRFEFDKQEFRKHPDFRALPGLIRTRLGVIRAARKSADALDRLDFPGLRESTFRYVGLPFELARRNRIHVTTELEGLVRELAAEFKATDQAFEAREKARAAEAARAFRAEAAAFAAQAAKSLVPTGRRILRDGGAGKTLLVFPPGKRRFDRAFAGRFRRGKILRRSRMAADQVSADLTGLPRELAFEARLVSDVEMQGNTSIEGFPECGRWRAPHWKREGTRDLRDRVSLEGPIERDGERIVATAAGTGKVTLAASTLERGAPKTQGVTFRFTTTKITGRDRNGRPIRRQVSETKRLSCPFTPFDPVDAPVGWDVAITALARVEFTNFDRPFPGGELDHEPRLEARVVLTSPDGERSFEMSRLTAGENRVGLVVEAVDPPPAGGVGRRAFRAYVRDSAGEELAAVDYSVGYFRGGLEFAGPRVALPELEPHLLYFGPGSARLAIEGPFRAANWRLDWGLGGAKAGAREGRLAGRGATLTLGDDPADDFGSLRIRPRLTHRETGMGPSVLGGGRALEAGRVDFRPPRLTRMFVRGAGSARDRSVRGATVFSFETTDFATPVRDGGSATLEAVLVDEAGTEFPGTGPLPGHLRLRQGALAAAAPAGVFEFRGGGRTLAVSGDRIPGRGRAVVQRPDLRLRFRTFDGPHVFHPDFSLDVDEMGLLHNQARVVRTVDFKTGAPALQVRLAGGRSFEGFEVEWPGRAGPFRTAVSAGADAATPPVAASRLRGGEKVTVFNRAGLPIVAGILKPLRDLTRAPPAPRPKLARLVTPAEYNQGEPMTVLALIERVDAFGAVDLRCRWTLSGAAGELLDGPETPPELDAELRRHRCRNRLEFPVDPRARGRRPRVTVELIQKERERP